MSMLMSSQTTVAAISLENPHSAHDRTEEWRCCCMEIFMGRDPEVHRLAVDESSDAVSDDDSEDDEDSIFGCRSSPGYLAINMIKDENLQSNNQLDKHANLDSWMRAAFALSTSIDEVSLMIQRKAVCYVSSTDTLDICFNNGNSPSTEHTMTNADRSILETTVASFAAGMVKQIDSLRQMVVVEGDHPFSASGPIVHRAGIASCLMQRLKSEIMDPMTRLQSQREKSTSKKNNNSLGDEASKIARNPMRMFRLGADDSMQRPFPPAPWEVGGHEAEKDRAEQEQEKHDFLGVYFEEGEMPNVASTEEIAGNFLPPESVMRYMDLPDPIQTNQQQLQQHQSTPKKSFIQQAPQQNIPPPSDEEHMDQLERESATLLATYQHSDLEGVQKVERSMVDITQLLSRFTDLITEQQEDIFTIHDQALKSKENVDKGQDQLVDAANRGAKSKHPMATFIVVMTLLLLLFNWITP